MILDDIQMNAYHTLDVIDGEGYDVSDTC